ncbi:hypothetical protein B0H19DRAFT_1265082 [Mycena capillaripes]|nr:hypothetical protein B0H19DRAFT_1265082 [Mycena capillaripes]
MSASATKSRFTAFGIHLVPAHLSPTEFSARMEALADGHLALPIAELTAEYFAQFLKDQTVAKSISDAPEFVNDSTDAATRIDTFSTDDSGTWIDVLRRPPNFSSAQFYQKFGKGVDGLAAFPMMRKNLVKHAVWIHGVPLPPRLSLLG